MPECPERPCPSGWRWEPSRCACGPEFPETGPNVPGGDGGGDESRPPGSGGEGGGQPGGTGPCPPGQQRHPTRGDCRFPGDMPCGPNQCKDVVTGVCRRIYGNEAINDTDDTERPTGGGRGYCTQNTPGSGGGGSGGGFMQGAGGGTRPGGSMVPGFNWDRFNKLLSIGNNLADPATNWLKSVLEGGTRYSPQVMQWLAAQGKSEAEGQLSSSRDSLNEELAARGVARGNFGATRSAQLRDDTNARLSGQMNQHRVTKVNADFEDKVVAVNRMLGYVNELRTYAAQLNMTEAEREKLEATIKLGYEQLKQQFSMLQMQLASNKELLGMSLQSQELLAMLRMQFGL